MPPQGYVVLGGLAWNYAASRMGQPTISQFARRHKVLAVVVWCGVTVWLIPHWCKAVEAISEAIDEATL